MTDYNVIGDIAGQYKALRALLDKMPPGKPLSVGDMVDRGPNSKEVVEFFMAEGEALLGNHEHMMVDFHDMESVSKYESGIWAWNGGDATLKSFGQVVPKAVLDWAGALPFEKVIDYGDKKFFVSHSFRDAWPTEMSEFDQIWEREYPVHNPEYELQIAGHNSHFGLRYWHHEGKPYAVCIDTSRTKVLTGIHLPSMVVYQQEYID